MKLDFQFIDGLVFRIDFIPDVAAEESIVRVKKRWIECFLKKAGFDGQVLRMLTEIFDLCGRLWLISDWFPESFFPQI